MRAFALAFVVWLAPVPARAEDGLRCGDWLVTLGAGEAEVAAKCGPPTDSEREDRVWRTRARTMHYTVDLWTYDRGPSEFVLSLAFVNGVLGNVAVGDYGRP